MKINLILSVIFLSALFYGWVDYSHGIVGLTKLNGDGCVCHGINPDQTVNVWIEGPDSVEINQTVTYKLSLTGGPAVAGGFNAASITGILFPADTSSKKISLELTHAYAKLFSGDTVSWYFTYTAPSAVQWDTIYSVAQSVNNDGIPNNLDKWNFGTNFPVKVVPFVPVELTSFTAEIGNEVVTLLWSTASETNNAGFEIERSLESGWNKIAYIEGNGTTAKVNNYTYTDHSPVTGTSFYRLKQIDYDGQFSYSDIIEVKFDNTISSFSLEQNYPNPFNPVTKIRYSIPANSQQTNVLIKIYDMTGKLISLLVNEEQSSGTYEVEFNGALIASGIYFYVLEAGDFSETRKFVLMK